MGPLGPTLPFEPTRNYRVRRIRGPFLSKLPIGARGIYVGIKNRKKDIDPKKNKGYPLSQINLWPKPSQKCRVNTWGLIMNLKSKLKKDVTIRSSVVEYLTFMISSGESGVEAVYADENVWLTQKMMGLLYNANSV